MYEKWRLLQNSQECYMMMAAQFRPLLVICKIAMWFEGFRARVFMKVNMVRCNLMIPCSYQFHVGKVC